MIQTVAEFGQSCRGDLTTAIRQADMAKTAGCTHAKWQIFDAHRIAGPHAERYWDEKLGGQPTQLETFHLNGMLHPEGWRQLKTHCDQIGIGFLATPFDLEAVDLLEQLDVSAYKIASGDITYTPLLQKVAATGKPVFLSTGASYGDEIRRALDWLDRCDVTLLACSLTYPCPDSDANLARIQSLADLWAGPVGYSDHTLGVDTALAAVAAGATVLEKHCTLGTGFGVPDDRMALGPAELAAYVEMARLGVRLRGSAELVPVESEMAARHGARRSLHAARDIRAGERFGPDDFVCLRPAGPFEPADVDHLVGRTARCGIVSGEQIQGSDIA